VKAPRVGLIQQLLQLDVGHRGDQVEQRREALADLGGERGVLRLAELRALAVVLGTIGRAWYRARVLSARRSHCLGAVRGARVRVLLLAASVRILAAVLVENVRDLPVDVDDALVEIDVPPPQAERFALP